MNKNDYDINMRIFVEKFLLLVSYDKIQEECREGGKYYKKGQNNLEMAMFVLLHRFLNCEFSWPDKKPILSGEYENVKIVKDLPEKDLKDTIIYLGISVGTTFAYNNNWLYQIYKKYF